jgi:catalase
MLNGPSTFKGRKVGALINDGVDTGVVRLLQDALATEGAILKFVAPAIGGVEGADGTCINADEALAGGPSVVFDTVVLLVSDRQAFPLVNDPHARDFVADALAHLKFIGYVASAMPLLRAAGVDGPDGGTVELKVRDDVTTFVKACRKFRFFERAAARNTG